MENSTANQHGEFELEEASPSWRHQLPHNASESSLHSTAIFDEDSSEHVDENGIERFKMFTADEEKVIVKKLDRHLVLFIAFLYMLSFLDRSSESKRTYKRV